MDSVVYIEAYGKGQYVVEFDKKASKIFRVCIDYKGDERPVLNGTLRPLNGMYVTDVACDVEYGNVVYSVDLAFADKRYIITSYGCVNVYKINMSASEMADAEANAMHSFDGTSSYSKYVSQKPGAFYIENHMLMSINDIANIIDEASNKFGHLFLRGFFIKPSRCAIVGEDLYWFLIKDGRGLTRLATNGMKDMKLVEA